MQVKCGKSTQFNTACTVPQLEVRAEPTWNPCKTGDLQSIISRSLLAFCSFCSIHAPFHATQVRTDALFLKREGLFRSYACCRSLSAILGPRSSCASSTLCTLLIRSNVKLKQSQPWRQPSALGLQLERSRTFRANHDRFRELSIDTHYSSRA